jgi:pimeloyl-ACP methyl ester carboxylesterase
VSGVLAGARYRTLAPYLRGFGGTCFLDEDGPRSGQLTALGQDVIEFADALNLDCFTLVGHDWGRHTVLERAQVSGSSFEFVFTTPAVTFPALEL